MHSGHSPSPPERRAIVLDADEGTRLMQGRRLVKVGAGDSDGRTAIHVVRSPVGFPGPPLHRHRQDEAFVVIDGELLFRVGGDERTVTKGGVVYVPSGVAHAFVNAGASEATSVEIFLPGELEDMFIEVSALLDQGASREEMLAVWGHHGTEVVGPALRAP